MNQSAELDAFPPPLRKLIEDELQAGNTIQEIAHCFPAPPAGAYVKLEKPVTTRARQSGGGLEHREHNGSLYSGWFTDERGFYFVVEPPGPPPEEPDMDAIRAAHEPAQSIPPVPVAKNTFQQSMIIDYEKWHEGIGYDLDALRAMTPEERTETETMLIAHGIEGWRDVEALAEFDTMRSRRALRKAAKSADAEIRMAVKRFAPHLVSDQEHTASLVEALQTAVFYGGLSEAIDEAAENHPRPVIEALQEGLIEREGEVAVHFAALLTYIYGKADSPFDWTQRPFFLRFHTEDRKERQALYRELAERIGMR